MRVRPPRRTLRRQARSLPPPVLLQRVQAALVTLQPEPTRDHQWLQLLLDRVAALGPLPVHFSVAELRGLDWITEREAHTLTYVLREQLRQHAGLIGRLRVRRVKRMREGWIYELARC